MRWSETNKVSKLNGQFADCLPGNAQSFACVRQGFVADVAWAKKVGRYIRPKRHGFGISSVEHPRKNKRQSLCQLRDCVCALDYGLDVVDCGEMGKRLLHRQMPRRQNSKLTTGRVMNLLHQSTKKRCLLKKVITFCKKPHPPLGG
jgi:hypothetical protein